MGFKLNLGLLTSVNSLFKPNGYDDQGTWGGLGSGLRFSLDDQQENPGTVLLNLKTPHGIFSLPYTTEAESQQTCSRRPSGGPVPDASVRFAGTGFSLADPITFLSEDGVAEITILSKWEGDPAVRFAGTGLRMQDPAGTVEITMSPSNVTVAAGGKTWAFTSDGASWEVAASSP
jgi:hypothetical protein